jgi:dephospho-CoA kinase
MKKIGITGSLSSGKSAAAKIISNKKYPLFNADEEVKKIYSNPNFKKLIIKKFKIKNSLNIKRSIKNLIINEKINIKRLESIIHPLVRKKMRDFAVKNRKKKIVVFEIPLLVESNLMYFFDYILFINTKMKIRRQRYIKKGGTNTVFSILDRRQLPEKIKIKSCDYVVVNNKSLLSLKKKLNNIIKEYE